MRKGRGQGRGAIRRLNRSEAEMERDPTRTCLLFRERSFIEYEHTSYHASVEVIVGCVSHSALAGLDLRARTVHRQPDPPDAGTEHLDKSAATSHFSLMGETVKAGITHVRWTIRRSSKCALVSVVLAVATGFPFTAHAQSMTQVRSVPVNCRDLKQTNGVSGLQPWQAFVRMEHCDRIKRLVRLSAELPPSRQPIFYEGVVPADRLPAGFGVDLPVLRVVFPDHVFFDTAQSRLRPEADPLVAIIAESLRREPPDVALFVAGHADKRGEANYNQALSIDRANALAEAIFTQGVAYSSIWRIGFGEDMPLVPGEDEASLDQNRRIEFLFASKPEAVGVWMADQQLSELCQARSRLEAERCKAKLDLKRDYEAVEIVRRSPTRIDPDRGHGTSLSPIKPRPNGVSPSGTVTASVRPSSGGAVSVTPTASRRIRIDPILRRATPVRVDL